MPKRTLGLDKSASRLALRTRAEGLLARFAHDLEIVAGDFEVRAIAEDEGGAWTAEITVPVASLRVEGVLRGDVVDRGVLSAADRADIERKIRDEVLVKAREVKVSASGSLRERGEAAISIGPRSARAPVSQSVSARGGGLAVSGRCDLSLRALGIREVKAPLGAFRVSDTVEVVYSAALVPFD